MRRIEAINKEGKKVALLKEDANGNWRVFQYSNRQTYAAREGEQGWTEETAKKIVQVHIDAAVTFNER